MTFKNKAFGNIAEALGSFTFILPLVLSMCVCSGIGAFKGIIFAALCSAFTPAYTSKKLMPAFISFLIFSFLFKCYGESTAALAIILSGVLLAISGMFYKKLIPYFKGSAITGLMLAAALSVTIMFTTDYFGIGASGNTVREMLASYYSLGFHANWRGVLYGTITMVIMITFPRKFKKANCVISAPFVAVITTLILNLFLNPRDMKTAINEIGEIMPSDLNSEAFLLTNFEGINIPAVILCGIALFLISFYMIASRENAEKGAFYGGGAANCISGLVLHLPIPCGITFKKNILIPVISIVLSAILFIPQISALISRIPIHTCAVVLIVGAWQSVNWREVKNAFSGVFSVAVFTISAVICLFLGIAPGVIFAFAASAILSMFSVKKTSQVA